MRRNNGACCDDKVSSQKQSTSKTKRQPATCMICKRSFTSKKMLKNHHAKHHFFRHCPNCIGTFQQTKKFILHLQSHLHIYPYQCKVCLLRFQKKKSLLSHKKIGHNAVKTFTCDTCSEVFINFPSLARHYMIHIGEPYACDKCGAVFSNVNDRAVHIKNHLLCCKFCQHESVTFANSLYFMYHIFFEHTLQQGDYGFKFDISKLFKSIGTGKLEEDSDSDSMDDYCSSDNDSIPDIDNNYQKEAVEPVYNLKRKNKFICFICYALYPSPELLKSHMKSHNWYPCNSCPRFFAEYKIFKKHKQVCEGSTFFADNKTFKKHKQDCADPPSFICKNYDAEAECKSCGAKLECKNCKKNLSNATGDISKGSINVPPRQGMPFPKLQRYPVTKYCSPQIRKRLNDFIKFIKSKDIPLDVFRISHLGSHIANLEKILKENELRMLFPEEWIPNIEFLYSKFQDLSQNLND